MVNKDQKRTVEEASDRIFLALWNICSCLEAHGSTKSTENFITCTMATVEERHILEWRCWYLLNGYDSMKPLNDSSSHLEASWDHADWEKQVGQYLAKYLETDYWWVLFRGRAGASCLQSTSYLCHMLIYSQSNYDYREVSVETFSHRRWRKRRKIQLIIKLVFNTFSQLICYTAYN